MMNVTLQSRIKKWGNGQGLLLSKQLLEGAGLEVGDAVSLEIKDGKIVIDKIQIKKRHRSLKERFATNQGEYQATEWDTGTPKGDEIF